MNTYVSFLAAHPRPAETEGFSLELFLRRFDIQTANIIDNKPLAQRLAEAAGMSLHVATRVIAGLTPLTSQMVVAIAKRIGRTADELLTGARAHQPSCPVSSDEEQLLSIYRSADPLGKAAILFMVTLWRLLESLPDEGRDRVITSLIALYESGSHDELLAFLPSTLGGFKARTGIDPALILGGPTIFTPIHEKCGVYGPEQKPLWAYLEHKGAP